MIVPRNRDAILQKSPRNCDELIRLLTKTNRSTQGVWHSQQRKLNDSWQNKITTKIGCVSRVRAEVNISWEFNLCE